MRVVSIDPGSVHTGWAEWVRGDDGLWECVSAVEVTKVEAEDRLRAVGAIDAVACEGFFLRPDLAKQQIGSSFGEVELIGVARACARWAGIEFHVVTPGDRAATLARLKYQGYRFQAHGHGGHAKDAECVLPAALKLSIRDLRQFSDTPGAKTRT